MAITNNIEAVKEYDANQPVQSPRILNSSEPAMIECTVQCIAFEVLRSLIMGGYTVASYNDMGNIAWYRLVLDSVERASLNLEAQVNELTLEQALMGSTMGGNFFEYGYVSILDGTPQGDRVQFTRLGGLSQ